MSLVLQVDILGEYKNLTAATKGAQNQLSSLNKRTQSISNTMNKAFAAVGIGFSLGMVVSQLKEASKAAVEDNKSQVLLAESMKKTTGATTAQIKAVEKYISATELRTQVLDDKLRPAMAIALRSTGDMTKAQKLLNLAVDVSVGTGKDLEIVTKSIARAYDGNYTGLQKLVPGISKGSDALDQLKEKFDGAAEAAAKTDPYMQMQVIFNDMQEKIGMALLPVLNQLSTWLSTPEGQDKLQSLIELIVELIGNFTVLLGWVIDNKEAFLVFVGVVGALTVGLKLYAAAATFGAGATTALGFAAKAALPALTLVITALETIKWLNEQLDFSQTNINSSGGALNFSGQSSARPSAGGSNMSFITPKPAKKANTNNVTINVNNSNVTAQDIVNKLNKATRANGTIGAIF